jgi:hypothetical protein
VRGPGGFDLRAPGLHSPPMRMRVGSSLAVAALVLALAAPAHGQQAPTLGAPPAPDVTA